MSSSSCNLFTQSAGIEVPLICGPMYPCSNPELVAAVSEAGALGIVQPIALSYVHGYDFEVGLRYIRSLTKKPIGLNVLIEKNSRRYHQKMQQWVEQALQQGIRFFVTSMGKPDWVVDMVHAAEGIVYHDVTERKWALKGIDCGVDGLIAVNNQAGGHLGGLTAHNLYAELQDLGKPIICAGGIANSTAYAEMMAVGYSGVQMGTRFIATSECSVPETYKQALVDASATDIVTTECISGVPVSVILTPYIKRLGLKVGPISRRLFQWKTTRYIYRAFYMLRSLRSLKLAIKNTSVKKEFWQAGKSVAGVSSVLSVGDIVGAIRNSSSNAKSSR
ncbi:MAG: NAD(P)H-dependent flavin oxidoreductase [Thiohalomonadales bacterium]